MASVCRWTDDARDARPYCSTWYCLDRTEVPEKDYRACVASGACSRDGLECGANPNYDAGRPDHPINCVTKEQAAAFCRFRGKRLPWSGELEWAAQNGPRSTLYPWGNDYPKDDGPPRLCYLRGPEAALKGKPTGTCPVGSFPAGASDDGILDLSGNVWEWAEEKDSRTGTIHGGGYDSFMAESIQAKWHLSTSPLPPAMFIPTDDIGIRCAK
jgi:formylglycine-generating enzyme required for sulfatase activity